MRHLSTTIVIAAAALTAGCVVTPIGYHDGYDSGYDDAPVVYSAPPLPRVEAYGVAPAPGMIWLGGYWGWSGARYDWHPGHWARPRHGYSWVPHGWVPARGGWVHRRGHWRRH